MSSEQSSADGPLRGYRVIELCSTISGPACTRLMGEFGADVIKIEPPDGDSVRQLGVAIDGIALYAASILRNKKTVSINLKTELGLQLVRQLIAQSDVLVENFRPGTLERLGLDYDTLKQDNPGLVLVRISGYGQTGPYRAKPGYGAICEAFGGIRELIGEPGQPPVRVAVPVTDYMAATYAAFGATMALLEREKTGVGQIVDTALYETAFSMMEASVPGYDKFDYVPTREGSRLPYMAPNNLYRSADDVYVLLAANNNAIFARLAACMGQPELADDPRYATVEARWEHVDSLDETIQRWAAGIKTTALVRQLEEAGVPVSRVNTLADIYQDAHFAARDMLLAVEHDVLGTTTQIGIVPKLSATPGRVRWAGHELAADTRSVLEDVLNLDKNTLDALEAEAIIQSNNTPRTRRPA